MNATAPTVQAGTMPAPNYVLKDELAQFCLPKSEYDPGRKVAWTNTLCVCVLAIGMIGVQTPAKLILKLKKDEPQVVEVETKAPPPQQFKQEERQEEEPEEATPEQPVIPTIVALNTPDVKFAVAVDGPVTVTANAAIATPPPRIADRPVPQQQPGPKVNLPKAFRGIGRKSDEGYIPQMTFNDLPKSYQANGRSFQVKMLWKVSATGEVSDVHPEKGSAYPEVDRFLADWIKRKGVFAATGEAAELYYLFEFNIN